MRRDGLLDAHCLRCGADGYWHRGHRHDQIHPSGKVLIDVSCDWEGADAFRQQ